MENWIRMGTMGSLKTQTIKTDMQYICMTTNGHKELLLLYLENCQVYLFALNTLAMVT